MGAIQQKLMINKNEWNVLTNMEKAFFDFVSILNKLKIPWWLDGGQLLRLYREDAFALNEVDFDIGVLFRFKSVIKTILNSVFTGF